MDSHSYAAGEALPKNPIGASVAGISANGSISSCVSIFPEMRSLNRIGGTTGSCRDNYGFAGTVARKSDGTILTPDPDTMGADKLYGADATAEDLKDPEFYKKLGWNFDSTWTMDSTGEYAFPILPLQLSLPVCWSKQLRKMPLQAIQPRISLFPICMVVTSTPLFRNTFSISRMER